MNFDFNEDQQMVRDQVHQVLSETCPMSVVRSVLEGARPYADAAWRELGRLGYLGVAVPESYGGLGLGELELCVIAEEIGRTLAPLPISSSIYLASETLLGAGSDSQKRNLLPALATGERLATVAFTSLDGVALLEDRVDFDGERVRGTKIPVADGGIADVAIIVTEERGGGSLALVELDQPGVTREPVGCVDPTRPMARLRFDDARAERLGPAGGALPVVEYAYDRAAVLMAFEQLGGAEAALEMARSHAISRYAFGRPIGSYQAIKHKLVDMYARIQIARGHCTYAAWALSAGAADLPLAAAGARIAATRAFDFAAQENVQVHGGVGFTWEHDCHLFYRRARLQALALGAMDRWRERLVSRLESSRAA